jgi:transposase
MSKKGRKIRAWHYKRIEEEFGYPPEDVIRGMFEADTPLTVMAGALGISYPEMHEWVKELNLERPSIAPENRHLTKERLWDEHGQNPVTLICSDRAMGMTYREIRRKYDVSQGFVANCLRQGASWLIGDRFSPVTVRPPLLSNEERQRRSRRCKEHNRYMKEAGRGWFADHHLFFKHKGNPERWKEKTG